MEDFKNDVFKIITSAGTGSGFAIKGYDFVVTNYHVIEGAKKVAIEDQNKNRYFANVIMVNPEADLAFLKPENLSLDNVAIQIDENLQITNTQKIFINGFPFGLPYTVTEGIISSVNQNMGNRNLIQTDAAVNPGNSGGPMLNHAGVIVGVTTSKFNNADNIGFGIKHTDLVKELNDFKFNDNLYRVKCNSCDSFTATKTSFCASCGNKINDAVFEEFEKSALAVFIESSLEEININPVICRSGRDQWDFHYGSALIRIFIYNANYLFVTTPLNKLPKNNLEDLYSYILKDAYKPFMIGVYQNAIYLSYRLYLPDVFTDHAKTIKENIKKMPQLADELDNLFVEKFKCEFALESKLD